MAAVPAAQSSTAWARSSRSPARRSPAARGTRARHPPPMVRGSSAVSRRRSRPGPAAPALAAPPPAPDGTGPPPTARPAGRCCPGPRTLPWGPRDHPCTLSRALCPVFPNIPTLWPPGLPSPHISSIPVPTSWYPHPSALPCPPPRATSPLPGSPCLGTPCDSSGSSRAMGCGPSPVPSNVLQEAAPAALPSWHQ